MRHYRILFSFLSIILISCQHGELSDPIENQASEDQIGSGITVPGKELEIPFTVKNMQATYDNLTNNRTVETNITGKFSKDGDEIQASHYYFRFLPKDSLEYELLVKDSILDIVNEPLHYGVEVSGDGYFDPELDPSLPYSWQYSVFPVDYEFPGSIEHELLEEMYFPPEDNTTTGKNDIPVYMPLDKTSKKLGKLGKLFFELLETEALKITGNLDKDELSALNFIDGKGTPITYQEFIDKGLGLEEVQIDYSGFQDTGLSARRWSPSGRVTVTEDALAVNSPGRTQGVVSAEIKIRKWGFLVIKKTRTDVHGRFRSGSTRTKRVKYAVYFNNSPTFRINQNTTLVEARHRGTRTYKYGAWNQHFSGGRAHFYSLVQNAAWDYYNTWVPFYRLQRPRSVNIKASYDKDISSQHRNRLLGTIASDLRISRIRGGRYRGSDGIYATTAHELTHASHNALDPGMFSAVAGSCRRDMLKESWAEGVETIVTNERYRRLDRNYRSSNPDDQGGRWNSWRQRQTVAQMNEYTPIVEDLIDNLNQNATNAARPVDNVNGYTLQQIQTALDNSRNPNTWRDKLNAVRPTGVTTTELNTLFAYMNQALNNPQTCD